MLADGVYRRRADIKVILISIWPIKIEIAFSFILFISLLLLNEGKLTVACVTVVSAL